MIELLVRVGRSRRVCRGRGSDAMVGFPCPFPCRADEEVSVPDGSTPVGEVVIVI
jgi:hypothetical protein